MKEKKKRKGLRLCLCSVLVAVMCFMVHVESYAYTSDDVPGVEFTADGQAWTVKEPLPADLMAELNKKARKKIKSKG